MQAAFTFAIIIDEIEYMPYDQPLHITNDPSYKAQIQLEYTVLNINTLMRKKKMSPYKLANKTGLSILQIQNALNPKRAIKNVSHLYNLAAFVGLNINLHTSRNKKDVWTSSKNCDPF